MDINQTSVFSFVGQPIGSRRVNFFPLISPILQSLAKNAKITVRYRHSQRLIVSCLAKFSGQLKVNLVLKVFIPETQAGTWIKDFSFNRALQLDRPRSVNRFCKVIKTNVVFVAVSRYRTSMRIITSFTKTQSTQNPLLFSYLPAEAAQDCFKNEYTQCIYLTDFFYLGKEIFAPKQFLKQF